MYKNTIGACFILNVKLKLSQNVMYIYSPYFPDISKINIAFAAKDR